MKLWKMCLAALLIGIPALGSVSVRAGNHIEAQDPKDVAEMEKARSLLEQDYLTGDWGGARTKLEEKGVTFGATYIGEVLGNVTGGIERSAIYGGRLQLDMGLDFEKLAGLQGSSFYVSAYEIHGKDLSAGSIGNIMTVSNIEAYDTFRLFNLWYQQEFLDGKISVRFGQLAADDEFVVSSYAATFINGTFGWPALTAANMYSGGPGYPLATPAVRVAYTPIEQFSLMAAVFDGDPGDSIGNPENPQKINSSGTRVSFNQGVLGMFEAAYNINKGENAKGLPGSYKVGGWFDTFHTPDVARDDSGLSLNDPATSGVAREHPDNWGVYFIADQMVWGEPGSNFKHMPVNPNVRSAKEELVECCPTQGLGLFWRIGGTPSDRNLVEFYTDGGFNYTGLIPGRDADIFGFAVGFSQISGDQRNLELEANNLNGANAPVSGYEMVFEWTYQIVLAPWWTVQPDIQYIVHPGGGNVVDPEDASGEMAVKDALVLGLRTSITF